MEAAGVTCGRHHPRVPRGYPADPQSARRLVGGSSRTHPSSALNRAMRPRASPEYARVRLPPPRLVLKTRKALTTFTMIRALLDGGGGSRTRVRKWILQSLYVRSVTQCFARGGERATDPQASYLYISSLARAAPASDQPDSSTSRRPASGRQIRKRTTNRSYAANASSLLAIKVSPGVLRGPRNLGTLLHIHQTRRSRDAPDVLPAYGRPT